MNEEISLALQKPVETPGGDRGICVVITGAGRAFTSGADLVDVQSFYGEISSQIPASCYVTAITR